jgi:hypothetical protein
MDTIELSTQVRELAAQEGDRIADVMATRVRMTADDRCLLAAKIEASILAAVHLELEWHEVVLQ